MPGGSDLPRFLTIGKGPDNGEIEAVFDTGEQIQLAADLQRDNFKHSLS